MSTPTLLVVTATPDPDQSEALQTYSEMGPPQLIASGAVPKFRAKLVHRVTGEGPSSMVFVAEFPSLEQAKTAFETEAYKEALPFRDKAFQQLDIMLMEAI